MRDTLGRDRVSERRACRVLGQSRSTQRRTLHVPDDEPRLVKRMTDLATAFGRYGYRRITMMLRKEGWRVNHTRIERLWRRDGLKVPAKQPKRRRWLHKDARQYIVKLSSLIGASRVLITSRFAISEDRDAMLQLLPLQLLYQTQPWLSLLCLVTKYLLKMIYLQKSVQKSFHCHVNFSHFDKNLY